MEMIPQNGSLPYAADYEQAFTGQATWTVTPSGGITATRVSETEGSGIAIGAIAGNGAPLGNEYRVDVSVAITSGTDIRSFWFKVGPAAVS